MIRRDRTFSASSIQHEQPAVNSKQFEAVTEELILLSTRNANLEQQLDEIKKKYDSLQDQMLHSMKNSQSDATQIQAPIGFICDELNLNRKTLSEHIVMDQIEQLYFTVNAQLTFTDTQRTFMKLVSEEISDELLGLLNLLVASRAQISVFHRCVIMEMVIYINAEWEDDPDQIAAANNGDHVDLNAYDLKTIYSISDKMGVDRNVVNEIDTITRQRLNSDTKIESLIASGSLPAHSLDVSTTMSMDPSAVRNE